MSTTIAYLFYTLALALAVYGAYLGKVVEACLKIGTALEGAPGPTGFQDAITPPETTKGIMVNWVATASVLFAAWWFTGLTVFAITAAIRIIGRVVAGTALNSKSWESHFIRRVFASMCRRIADYTKTGDNMRAKAMSDLIERFRRSEFAARLNQKQDAS